MKSILQKILDYLKNIFTLDNIFKVLKSKTFAYVVVGVFALIAFDTCQSKQDLVAEKTKLEHMI